jgi:hypothetical protein
LIYAFPVSYYPREASSYDRRKYNQINNLKKYNLNFDEIYSAALLNMMKGQSDWNKVNFPNREQQYPSTTRVHTTLFISETNYFRLPGTITKTLYFKLKDSGICPYVMVVKPRILVQNLSV